MSKHRAPATAARAVRTAGPGRHVDRRPLVVRAPLAVLALLVVLVALVGAGTGHAMTPPAPASAVELPAVVAPATHPAGGSTAVVEPAPSCGDFCGTDAGMVTDAAGHPIG